MKKLSLLFTIAVFTLIISSCSKTEVQPPSLTGKWTMAGIGAYSDTKAFDATLDELRKVSTNPKEIDNLAAISVEFKADESYIFGTDAGKFAISADRKTLTLTSSKDKDGKGNPTVQTFELLGFTTNELKMGFKKITKKATDKKFTISLFTDPEGFISYVYALAVFTVKDKDNVVALEEKSTFFQMSFNYKK
jgi:hypothetical protein